MLRCTVKPSFGSLAVKLKLSKTGSGSTSSFKLEFWKLVYDFFNLQWCYLAEWSLKFKITEKMCWALIFEKPQQPEEKAESESEAEMEEDEEDEIPLDMEDIEAVSKRARQDEDLNTEHLQVIKHHIIFTHYGLKSFSLCFILVRNVRPCVQ